MLVEDRKVANRSFVIDRAGEIRATYDKMHLFDVDLPTGESWRESSVYAAGKGAVLVNGTPVGRLGLTICYDLRFPAFSRASPNRTPTSLPFLPPSPSQRARRTGTFS